uniref:Uncharacterized protein n=1 Tax=Arundo donax TaxID=35708 RepID=A0A0A8YK69_ARUDO
MVPLQWGLVVALDLKVMVYGCGRGGEVHGRRRNTTARKVKR